MFINILWVIFGGLLIGFLCAQLFYKFTKKSISSFTFEDSVQSILKNAQQQREMILREAQLAAQEKYEDEKTHFDLQYKNALQIQEKYEQTLVEKLAEVENQEKAVQEKHAKVLNEENEQQKKQEILLNTEEEKRKVSQSLEKGLEQKAGQQKPDLVKSLVNDMVHAEKLNLSRFLMEQGEQLKVEAQKKAQSILNDVYLRYQPQFIWPKIPFVVATPSKNIAERYFQEASPMLSLLLENTDTNLSVMSIHEDASPLIKISGGAGVDKEIIRLTLEEMFARDAFQEDRVRTIMEKHRKYIEKFVVKMGEDALKALGFKKDMHVEILKLIGSLNYRTSHRQNQYFHSLEVATLAGMLAKEVGVDPAIAKRAGILHDIGKVLDYKIEGSHAVISGDYATRFGESEVVVDTVLAHHDDKIVETPYAYILKAADAMSGARPGARVDMEEGYNRRIDGISGVVNSFGEQGVTGSAIMHAGREVHVFVDNTKVKPADITELAKNIAQKLESDVEYPGQIRVTVIRRTEITEVA